MTIKKPVIIATSIVCASIIFSMTSIFVCRGIKRPSPEPTPDPDLGNLIERYEWCKENHKDPLTYFKLYEISNLPIMKFKANPSRLTITHGKSLSMGSVLVDVTVSSIVSNGKAYEESISYSDFFMAPKTGNRAYDDGESILRYSGVSTNPTTVNWKKEGTPYTKEKHLEESGKEISDPFFFVLSEQTILVSEDPNKNSYVKKKEDGSGYLFELQLKCDNFPKAPNAVEKYSKRIHYLSNDTELNSFTSLKLKIETDNDFNIILSQSSENYKVIQYGLIPAPTTGNFEVRYYTTDVPQIPTIDQNFDYSIHPF